MGTIGIGRGMSDLLGNLNCIIGHRFQETENADYHHGVLTWLFCENVLMHPYVFLCFDKLIFCFPCIEFVPDRELIL